MSASIPFMITAQMRSELAEKGFTQDQIRNMKPEDAWAALGGMPSEAKPDNLALALRLVERGWYVFPCHESAWSYTDKKTNKVVDRKAKEPYWNKSDLPHGKDNASIDPALIKTWWKRWPTALVGIYCEKSGIFAVDIDTKNGIDGISSWFALVDAKAMGEVPECGPMQETPSGGLHLIFKLPDNLVIPNNAGKLGPGLDLRSAGYICTGELPDGSAYTWQPEHEPTAKITDAPSWLLELIRDMGGKPVEQTPAVAPIQSKLPGQSNDEIADFWLKKALEKGGLGNGDETGLWLAVQLRDARCGTGEIESALRAYAQRVPQNRSDPFTEKDVARWSKSALSRSPREPAKHQGAISFNGNGHNTYVNGGLQNQPEKKQISFLPGDIDNGRRFAAQFGGLAAYASAMGWLTWDGRRWEIDETGRAANFAKILADDIYTEAKSLEQEAKALADASKKAESDEEAIKLIKKSTDIESLAKLKKSWAEKSRSRGRQEAMLVMAQSEHGIAARTSAFDGDPWLLNCENGILDLKTGELHPHDPSKRLMKIAGTKYDKEAACPRWLSFLDRIFKSDQTMIDFIQRAAGYTLTGDIGEQAFFFLHGGGANGKSTFTETIQSVLGDYARKSKTETLMTKKNISGANNDVARLAGARMVSAAELGEGHRLNEALIKDLTGGDVITARFLYREDFQYKPTFKIWMYGNHTPGITGTDDGIKRRIKMIPFEVRIPDAEQDKKLCEKLREELPGILAWMVRGCLDWQRQGLKYPQAITTATNTYLASEDVLGAFLEDCCTTESSIAAVQARDLYTAFKLWAVDTGAEIVSEVIFSRRMAEKGFRGERAPGDGRKRYSGVGLLT